ncbi:MAG: DUF2953 domain-containing protein [Clostridiales bacterium]|nr:DUF2953 domain-containing protein [Clostridiales bacterium]
MVYIVLAVLFLHISVMRIVIRLEAVFDSDEKYTFITVKLFFITVFKYIPTYNRVVDTATDVKKSAEKIKGRLLNYIARAVMALLKRIEVRSLGLRCRVGTGDAASTALVYGSIHSAFDATCSFFDCQKYSEVVPEYDRATLYLDFGGIISLCLADIIYAALSALRVRKKTSAAPLTVSKT